MWRLVVVFIVIFLLFSIRPTLVCDKRGICTDHGDILFGKGAQGKVFITSAGDVKKKYYKREWWENNVKSLGKIKKQRHIPRVFGWNKSDSSVTMEYCGIRLTPSNCPENIKEQLEELDNSLREYNLFNSDFKNIKNYTIKNNEIYLVDWGSIREHYKPHDFSAVLRQLNIS